MIETPQNAVAPDTRTAEEKSFDAGARDYADIPEPVNERENPDALFANGWGRRGHFALLVAPSGVGKSVISTQLLVPWAAGRPGLVGSAPLIPLRIAVIQAEDDDTEMAEFRRDHRLGHMAEGWTLQDILAAERKIKDWSPFFRGKVGDGFLRGLELALRRQPVDVVILNPLQSYAEIDLNKNREITEFLRNGIDPILSKYRVLMLCVHHTNKPQIDKNKGGVFGDDAMSAYVGAGGAELTNYARSVTFIRRCTEKECKVENSFMLVGAKRGNRLGWKDAEGKRTVHKIIAYSPDYIHWRVPSREEIEETKNPVDPASPPPRQPVSSEEAADLIAEVIRTDCPKVYVRSFVYGKLHRRIGDKAFAAGWSCFSANPRAYGMKKVSDGARGAYHFEPDSDAASLNRLDDSSEDDDLVDPYWNV